MMGAIIATNQNMLYTTVGQLNRRLRYVLVPFSVLFGGFNLALIWA
jgi:hypothetical protein